jgi:hypothetical protein
MPKGTIQSIKAFISGNSYLQKQTSDADDLSFTTRRNCRGGQCGEADVDEAYRVKKLLLTNFDNISVEVGGSDEWVSIYIEII